MFVEHCGRLERLVPVGQPEAGRVEVRQQAESGAALDWLPQLLCRYVVAAPGISHRVATLRKPLFTKVSQNHVIKYATNFEVFFRTCNFSCIYLASAIFKL